MCLFIYSGSRCCRLFRRVCLCEDRCGEEALLREPAGASETFEQTVCGVLSEEQEKLMRKKKTDEKRRNNSNNNNNKQINNSNKQINNNN